MMERNSLRWIVRSLMGGLLAVTVFSATVAWAAQGKLSGQVLNKNSKEPLLGASVLIEGTTMGSMTDLEGRFQILAVPVGTYSVRVSTVGFQAIITEEVEIKPNETKNLTFELEQSAVKLPPVRVIAKQDLLQIDQVDTKRNVSADNIKTLPVTNVGDILKSQPGVTVRNDRFHIRGGRSSELIYNVDGVSMTDPLGGRGPTQALNLSGTEIENVSIVKGAWSPEYGGTSGIINVQTKDGGSKTTGHVQYFTDNFGTKNLNRFSNNFQRFEFNLGGPEPFITKKLLPAIGLGGPSDKLNYFISLNFQRTDTYTPINDYTSSSTLARFREVNFLGIVTRERQKNFGDALVKFSYRLSPDIRMTAQYKKTYERNMLWKWAYRDVANNIPWEEDENNAYSVRWTHNLSKKTYYEVQLSRFDRTFWQRPGDPNVAGGTVKPSSVVFPENGDRYEDLNGNGSWDPPENWTDVYPDGQYTFGDIWIDRDEDNIFTSGIDTLLFDFNNDGNLDVDAGEPFIDRNQNGIYDFGDRLTQDGNTNGTYDPQREANYYAIENVPNDIPEPFIDGDVSLGEPFTDINRNGVWDATLPGYPFGEPYNDLSYDSKYQSSSDEWVEGIPYRDLNGNGVFDPGATIPSGTWTNIDANFDEGEPFRDVNGDGIRNPQDGFYNQGYDEDMLWHFRRPIDTKMRLNLVSQMRPEHEVKIGGEYTAFDLQFEELQQPFVKLSGIDSLNSVGEPYPGRGSVRDFYHQTPKTGAFYVVDKMEYGQMIAQVGFRYEYFIQAGDAARAEEQIAKEVNPDSSIIFEDYRDRFAPRIAFSYPISDKAKVFFNYGHFYQMPQLFQMYARSTFTNSDSGVRGNLDLDFMKTIKYEFGVQVLLSPEYLFSIQGFYTDEFGRIAASSERGCSGQDCNDFYENSEYSRTRGMEFELTKKYGNYISGSVTYDLSWAYGKSSAEALDYFENFYADVGGNFAIQEFPLDWDQRHAMTFILDIRLNDGDHPKLFGLTLPDKWGLNIFWQFGSGFPYTPTSDHPGVAQTLIGNQVPQNNSRRFPSSNNVDIRFNKDFAIGPMDYVFDIWVENLFDERSISNIYTATGRAETGVLQSGVIYSQDGVPNPRNWDSGRQVRLGLGLNF